jgi:hypothetical protein
VGRYVSSSCVAAAEYDEQIRPELTGWWGFKIGFVASCFCHSSDAEVLLKYLVEDKMGMCPPAPIGGADVYHRLMGPVLGAELAYCLM